MPWFHCGDGPLDVYSLLAGILFGAFIGLALFVQLDKVRHKHDWGEWQDVDNAAAVIHHKCSTGPVTRTYVMQRTCRICLYTEHRSQHIDMVDRTLL